MIWIDAQLRAGTGIVDDLQLFKRCKSLIDNKSRVEYWFYPLKKAGLEMKSGKIGVDVRQELQVGVMRFVFNFTFNEHVTINYCGSIIHFSPKDKILLQNLRFYYPETMIRFFDDHEFQLIDEQRLERDGQFLFKKK